jgi:uncharacterized protein (DUF302 family)
MIDGLISVSCSRSRSPADAADRLEREVTARGMQVFARIDHAAGAASVGLALPPTIVVIFGDPRAGTHLMQAVQEIAIDLPLKMLCWTDASGQSSVGFIDPRWLTARYGIAAATPLVDKMHAVMTELAHLIAG